MKSEQYTQYFAEETRGWLDLIGSAVTWLCVIQCTALPFFISLLPLVGLSFLLDESVEWMIIGAFVLIAAASLLPAYFRQHGKIRTIVLFVAGISLIVVSHLAFEEELTMQIPFLLAGAGLITTAYLVNRRLCRTCVRCENHSEQANC